MQRLLLISNLLLASLASADPAMLSATKDAPFVNSLGMKFVPLPTGKGMRKVLCSIWETRTRDYAAFMAQSGYQMTGLDADEWKTCIHAGIPVGRGTSGAEAALATSTHPVASVSWNDAQEFVKWLTKQDRAAGKLGPSDRYALPTDAEWSYAVGLGNLESSKATPEAKNGMIQEVYPWAGKFTPSEIDGNYCGQETKGKVVRMIDGYRDKWPRTAPVGSFKANPLGIYDLGGNLSEWCQDTSSNTSRVLRGCAWGSSDRAHLASAYRNFFPPINRYNYQGFRCVVVIGRNSSR